MYKVVIPETENPQEAQKCLSGQACVACLGWSGSILYTMLIFFSRNGLHIDYCKATPLIFIIIISSLFSPIAWILFARCIFLFSVAGLVVVWSHFAWMPARMLSTSAPTVTSKSVDTIACNQMATRDGQLLPCVYNKQNQSMNFKKSGLYLNFVLYK